MRLIKLKKISVSRERRVYKYKTHYRKHWNFASNKFFTTRLPIHEHVEIVNKLFPGYILGYKILKKCMWIDYKIIPGIPASEYFWYKNIQDTPPKDKEFIKKIYNFCIDNIRETAPYAHYDWTLDNIIVDGDNLQLVDWDLCAIYTDQEIKERFESCYISQLYRELT